MNRKMRLMIGKESSELIARLRSTKKAAFAIFKKYEVRRASFYNYLSEYRTEIGERA